MADDGTLPIYTADYTNNRYWVQGIVYNTRVEFEVAALAALIATGFRTGTAVVWLTTPANHSATQNIWNFSDGTSQNRIALRRSITPNTQYDVTTGNVSQAQIFAGTLADSTAVRVACAWAVNDFQVSALGGGSLDTLGTVPLGLNNIARLTGYETVYSKETVFAVRLPTAEVSSWTMPDNSIAANGDSFIEGGVSGGPILPSILQTASGRPVLNYGHGGDTIEQEMARQGRSARAKNFVQLIWDGDQNGIVTVSDYISKIQAGMSGYSKFIIIPPFVDRTQTDVTQEVAIRDAMVAAFGTKVLDWRTFATLDGNGNPTDAMYAKTDGSDNIHGSTSLMNAASTAIINKLSALGY